MISIQVGFDSGRVVTTRFNSTFEEASAYYLGQCFTFWDGGSEVSEKCTSILLLAGGWHTHG